MAETQARLGKFEGEQAECGCTEEFPCFECFRSGRRQIPEKWSE